MKETKAKITNKKNLEQGLVAIGLVACTDSKSLGAIKKIKESCYA